jgi:hypothetical protein
MMNREVLSRRLAFWVSVSAIVVLLGENFGGLDNLLNIPVLEIVAERFDGE